MNLRTLLGGGRRLMGRGEAELIPQGRMSGPMPWVIAIMVAMTAIALAAGLALGNAVSAARAEIEGGVTIQIVEPRADLRAKQAKRAVAAIKDLPGIAGLRLVPQTELDALIEPWLGTGIDDATGTAIPVPALIDVRLDRQATPARLAAMEQAVMPVAPSAKIDAQSNWLKPVFDAMVSLQLLAMVLVGLLALALAAAVLLAARSALGANRDTIEIVHLLGGSDEQVARVFQRSILFDALAGGVLGLALGTGAILLVAGRFAALDSGMVAGGTLLPTDWAIVALVPLFAVGIAVYTARMTVLSSLRKML